MAFNSKRFITAYNRTIRMVSKCIFAQYNLLFLSKQTEQFMFAVAKTFLQRPKTTNKKQNTEYG